MAILATARRRLFAGIIAALWLAGTHRQIAHAQDDAFIRQRQLEAEQNTSTGFSIAFADDQRALHPGETVKLVFTFRRNDISPFNYEHCHGMGIATAVLDHTDGTADPAS